MRNRPALLLLTLIVATSSAGCDPAAGFFNLFGNGVTVVVENDTAFRVVPDIRHSDSSNFVEDFFRNSEETGGFGTLAPNQTIRVSIPCDGDLEMVGFGGASFQDANGFPMGDINRNEVWRRDSDFDCGDEIHITLSGRIFNFDADTSVVRTTANANAVTEGTNNSTEEDIASLLDELFE